jgi:AraC-like DNA-binding protein
MAEQTKIPVPPRTPPKVQSLRFCDVDALTEAVHSSQFEHLQIEPGAFLADLKRFIFDDLIIDTGCYTRKVIARGNFPPGCALLGCVLNNREEGYINGYRFNRNDVVIFPKPSELDYIQPAGTLWYAIALSDAILEQAGGQEIPIDRIKVMPGNWPLTQLLRGFFQNQPDSMAGVACDARAPSVSKATLLDQIRYVLEQYQGDTDVRRPSLQRRMAIVRQFERHVCERIAEPLRIPELCSEMGVSPRVLEYVFKEELGKTPKQYLELLRLSAFRRELSRSRFGNKAISEIAEHYGIRHLGRLSAAYQRQFGELPSETLKR